MLPKENRLPSPEIKSVMGRGKRVHEAGLTLFYQKLDPRLRGDDVGEVSRFAIVVPVSVDKRAVGRNRLKRLVRESVRLALPSLAFGWDGVFMVRKGLGDDFASVNACVRDLLTRLKILS
ncbi:MAG: ribonuclease P protein component [Patescibacteria group bacterium]